MKALGPSFPIFLSHLEAFLVTHQNFVHPAVTVMQTCLFSVSISFYPIVLYVHSSRMNGISSILRIIYNYLSITQLFS